MPVVRLETFISAPTEICFDLSRSVDMHTDPPVAGVMSGMMELGDTVTWESTHFGRKRSITSKIGEMERPYRFVDVLIRGNFKKLIHDHTFEARDGGTLLIDDFEFVSPGGPLGWLLDNLLLKNYMRNILMKRNKRLREPAESGQVEKYIKPKVVSPGV
jgi:ligand-binding SRPBCC domain-containing protein